MEYKDCLKQIQTFLENNPLIILGSGSSAAYGLPLMSELSVEIKNHADKFDPNEFTSLCDNLDTIGLEDAIDKSALSEAALEILRSIVWKYINKRDLEFFRKLSQNKSNFAIADLLKRFIKPTPNTTTVITTNYDRVAEYAVDLIGATSVTGFEGNYIRALEFPSNATQNKRVRGRERVVNIWKVHGSLDWFSDANNNIVSFPLSTNVLPQHRPLIIVPGKGKYSVALSEPYRDVIAQADIAFSRANSYLCIGYGFNDDHIQPKLIAQIKNGKPIVVLCRSATDACKRHVISTDVKKYAVIERKTDGKTTVSGNSYQEEYDGSFWELPNFIKTIWG